MDYLSMEIKCSENHVSVSMNKYIKQSLRDYGVTGERETPADYDLFEIDDESPKLNREESELFHSRVARLLPVASPGTN